jgi:trk system potassium uptake protein TrkH
MSVYYHLFSRNFRKILKNEECGSMSSMVTASVSFLTVILYSGTQRNFELSFREAFFQVVSQISCTGFATTDLYGIPPLGMVFHVPDNVSGRINRVNSGGIKMADISLH